MIVLLYDGFEQAQVVGCAALVVAHDEGDVVQGGLLTVVADEAVVAVGVIDITALRLAEQRGAVGGYGVRQPQHVYEGGVEVGLLHDALATHGGVVRGVEEYHGYAVPAVIVVVFAREAVTAVVATDDEEGVVVPRMLFGGGEELAQGVVGVLHALEYGVATFDIAVFVLFGDGEGVVRGDGEDGGEEGLAEGADMCGGVLQEGRVVDAPGAVVVVSSKPSLLQVTSKSMTPL